MASEGLMLSGILLSRLAVGPFSAVRGVFEGLTVGYM